MRKIYSFTYRPFFETLKEKGISQNKFMLDNELSTAVMDRLRHNKNMTLMTIMDLMGMLGVKDMKKIVEIVVTIVEE
jgi:hypothetical protein